LSWKVKIMLRPPVMEITNYMINELKSTIKKSL
jgi:hypothetical protein